MPTVPRKRSANPVDFTIFDMEKGDVREMVIHHHYSGKCPGIKYAFGLYEVANTGGGEVVGTVVYSVPASYTLCKGVCGDEYKESVIELSRLVISTKTNNAASYLVGQSLKVLGNHVVVSYADCNDHIGHVGYVYQATNWIYTGHGNAEPVWTHPRTGEVISYTRRHIDDKARKYGLEWTDLVKVKQLGKHRYVFFTGDKKFKKEASKNLRYKILPYPKGATRRHESVVLTTADHTDDNHKQPPLPTPTAPQAKAVTIGRATCL